MLAVYEGKKLSLKIKDLRILNSGASIDCWRSATLKGEVEISM